MGRIILFASAVGSVLLLALVYVVTVGLNPALQEASASPAAITPAGGGSPLGTIAISAFDIGFDSASVDVETAGVYTVMFRNTGAIPHDLTFADGTKLAADAIHLVRGNAGSWGSQAVDLSPAQGAIIEFQTAEDGKYPMVTHAFNFVGRGALGLFQSGDGDPLN